MSSTVVTLLACLAGIYAIAAYVLRPPALMAWPDIRAPGVDPAQVRISVQARKAEQAMQALAAEKRNVSDLTRRAADLDADVQMLRTERDKARTQAYAAVRLAEEDALVIVRDMIEREAAEAGESSETVAARVFRRG